MQRLGAVMTTRGYAEAWERAEGVEVAPGLSLRVPTASASVVLKLFAWSDRRLLKHLQEFVSR